MLTHCIYLSPRLTQAIGVWGKTGVEFGGDRGGVFEFTLESGEFGGDRGGVFG